MRNRLTLLAALCAALLAGAVVAHAQSDGTEPVKLTAELDGQNEVPEKGDPNGTGTAKLRLNKETQKVCVNVAYERIGRPTAGHIHKGAEGVAGPIKVELFESTSGAPSPIRGCAKDVSKRLIGRIGRRPAGWYVNLHNAEYPDGAIRGQLVKPQG